jgi:hypothetical protein
MKSSPAPATELPRLMRYVDAGAMPGPNLLALYDKGQNLLVINRTLYEQLTLEDQRTTLRTHRTSLTVDLSNFTIN